MMTRPFWGRACSQEAEADGDDEDQEGNGKPEPPLRVEWLFAGFADPAAFTLWRVILEVSIRKDI